MTTLLSNRLRDPFTFATSSEQYGSGSYDRGKYPVKLYNSSSVLIYQEDIGGDNSGKLPSGGILATTIVASSMSETVTNPITFYWVAPFTVVNQSGQSSDLYNYYWSSYSRGTDGRIVWPNSDPNWHNDYLDSYIPSRHKSIYDPCPYGYRIPSHGTYNEFKSNPGWTKGSYNGGIIWLNTWLGSSPVRNNIYTGAGINIWYTVAIPSSQRYIPSMIIFGDKRIYYAGGDSHERSRGLSLRCIEDCSVVSDATEASKQKK